MSETGHISDSIIAYVCLLFIRYVLAVKCTRLVITVTFDLQILPLHVNGVVISSPWP